LLGAGDTVAVLDLLEQVDDWPAGRRLLARLTAVHNHPDVPAELVWDDGLRIDADAAVPWASHGLLRRSDAAAGPTVGEAEEDGA
jgi:hypothetical protein